MCDVNDYVNYTVYTIDKFHIQWCLYPMMDLWDIINEWININPFLNHSNSLHPETVRPITSTLLNNSHVREFHCNIFYCIRQHDKMLNTLLILWFIATTWKHQTSYWKRVTTCACNSFLLFEIFKRPSSSLPKHDSRMLPTFLQNIKIFFTIHLIFLENKRYDYLIQKKTREKSLVLWLVRS